MGIIGFLCVSLGSSTVKLHDSVGSRRACSDAGFSSETATVLEECTTKEQHCIVRFSVGKRTHAKDINKEMFLVYDGKCLSREAVHSLVVNVSLMTKRLKRKCGID
jgi:hypothetical protein